MKIKITAEKIEFKPKEERYGTVRSIHPDLITIRDISHGVREITHRREMRERELEEARWRKEEDTPDKTRVIGTLEGMDVVIDRNTETTSSGD